MRLRRMANRDTLWLNLALGVCIAYGLALIANTQSAADGGWLFYATFLDQGRRLYADMHLALQPLFVLETAAFLKLLGPSWLASKAPAVLHLAAYCIGLRMLAGRARLTDGQRAILLGCVFIVSICFEAYRFDDYHVLADCFEVYSLVVLLDLSRAGIGRSRGLVAALGVFSGLSLTTRMNDGAALFVAVAIAIVCLVPAQRIVSLLLFAVTAGLTGWLTVRLTGDSLHDYATYSIFHAAASKGGTGSVLAYPLLLPLNTLRWLKHGHLYDKAILYTFAVGVCWVFLLRPLASRRGPRDWIKAALGLAIVVVPMHRMHWAFKDITVVMSLSAVVVLVGYGLGLWVIARLLRWPFAPAEQPWDRREILLLIPLGQLASSSMSSAGVHMGLYGPVAMIAMVLAIASPIPLNEQWTSCLLTVATLTLCSGVYYRTMQPFAWHSYVEPPMFEDRQWYRHPVYGPMVIDRQLLHFIQPVCDEVGWSGPQRELLSLPFSYSNYFCSVQPWHGYVQTFFDTSTKETIDGLMGELQTSPPMWIFYQRQLDNLAMHEQTYNHGAPLPHRYLDQLIEQKIASGEWREVYTSTFEDRPHWSTEWILIRTR